MTNQIRCPKCGEIFKIDESSYESILKQIKDHEFTEELAKREKDLIDKQNAEIEAIKTKTEANYREEYNKLKESFNDKETELALLKEKLAQAEENKNNAVEKANQASLLKINDLENTIKQKDTEKELAIKEAVSEKEKEIAELNTTISTNEKNYIEKENNLKNSYDIQIKLKDEEIERYRDFKAKQSTKLVGESLEQHCEIEYNKHLRPVLTSAYFEKDNKTSKESGSKGDFIFRDYLDGNEYVSIMFEMKNEADTTEKKKKNEDFFKELDKDRNEKNCEYAILVSMLESDNELYNGGIVDVSHKYPKMYVVRPQFFISIITLIRNMALKSAEYKNELIVAQNQNIDITNFEENLNDFKDKFSKHYDLASRRFSDAIKEIDDTIKHLEKVKENLRSSEDKLRLANNKAQEITVKRLTKNAPSVKAKFDELKKDK